jgi:proteasome lid subunit RPN8/RPN11
VQRVVRARNLEESPTRYLIDPAEHFAAIREARASGLRVMGAYHSHPSSAPEPSETDIAEATGGPDFCYLIVSLVGSPGGEVRGYRVKNGAVRPVELVRAVAE